MKPTLSVIRNILLIVLLSIPLLGSADDGSEKYVMIVETTDGTSVQYELDEQPVVSFDKDSVAISTSTTEYIGYSKIERIRFDVTPAEPTGIGDIAKPEVTVRISRDEVVFLNVGTPATVAAFAISGTSMPADYTADGGNVTVRTASYPKGVYIFKVNNHSFKIIKK